MQLVQNARLDVEKAKTSFAKSKGKTANLRHGLANEMSSGLASAVMTSGIFHSPLLSPLNIAQINLWKTAWYANQPRILYSCCGKSPLYGNVPQSAAIRKHVPCCLSVSLHFCSLYTEFILNTVSLYRVPISSYRGKVRGTCVGTYRVNHVDN